MIVAAAAAIEVEIVTAVVVDDYDCRCCCCCRSCHCSCCYCCFPAAASIEDRGLAPALTFSKSVATRFLIAKHFTSQLLKLCFPLLHLSPQTVITLDNSNQIDDRRLAFLRHLHFLHF